MNEYKSLDVMKLIMAFLVVALHNDPFGVTNGYRYPLLMMPVPLFFIISSYLFFRKRLQLNDEEKRLQISKLISRNLRLYFAWFVILLPFTIYIREYFTNGIINGILEIFIDFLFGSTFRSSWFLVANVIGIVIASYLNKTICVILGVFCYVLCLFRTCYMGLLPTDCLLNRVIDLWPATFYQSFPIAIVWTTIGRILAETYNKWKKFGTKNLTIPVVISLILLVIEYCSLEWNGLVVNPGYCVTMLPACTLIVMTVCGIKVDTISNTKVLREISTVTYCMSTTLGWILVVVLKRLGVSQVNMPISLMVYISIVVISILSTFFIRRLQHIKHFSWCAYLK